MKTKIQKKTIVINATSIGYKYNGIGIYAVNLLNAITRLKTDLNFIVYLNKSCKTRVDHICFPGNFVIKLVSDLISPDRKFKGHLLRLIYSNYLALKHFDQLQFNTSQLEICFFKSKQVVMIHDVIPLLFKRYHKKQYIYFKWILNFGLSRAKFIITPSLYSKNLLQNIYNLPDRNVKVIYNGVDISMLKKNVTSSNELQPYILYIGRVNKMKNFDRILKSFSNVCKYIKHNLIVIGNSEKEFQKHIIKANISSETISRIIFKEDVNEEQKFILLKNASLLLFPTLYEGFGLPPLEAMACGCPVIVSNNSSFPEVCGDAAFYVDPLNEKQIENGILNVLNDPVLRRNMMGKGFQRAEKFAWSESAKKHLSVFEHIIEHSEFPARVEANQFEPVFSSFNNHKLIETA